MISNKIGKQEYIIRYYLHVYGGIVRSWVKLLKIMATLMPLYDTLKHTGGPEYVFQ